MKWFGLELTEICFFYSYQKWHSKKCLNDALCHNCNIFTCTQSISMKLILLESYEADLSNSGYNIQFGEELTEIQTNLYSVCKHSDTFLAHCTLIPSCWLIALAINILWLPLSQASWEYYYAWYTQNRKPKIGRKGLYPDRYILGWPKKEIQWLCRLEHSSANEEYSNVFNK